jgi:2-(1,2-epoxy-1,2-dihydrophenyl)acetyl-CoA isomerase
MTGAPGVRVTREDHCAIVELDWQASRNALGPDEVVELADAIDAAGRLDGIAAVVIAGRGKAFCAGGDLKKISELTADLSGEQITDVVYTRFHSLVRALRAVPVPTIAAVDGAAIGLGMDLVLACDIRLIGDSGYLAQGWAQAGLITGTGGAAFLERLRPGLTWQLLSQEPARLDAARASSLGLAEAMDGSALDAARLRAATLALLPAPTLRGYVELERPLRWPTGEFLADCARLQGSLLASEEFRGFVSRVLR